ncbi:MAG: transposase, partial [Planctomycetaceae bacterium]|nr:transposase [Planctomycetaceae bacterium]
RPCEVSAEEFIRRFLQHVLPTGLQKVRHYGFMHPRSKVAPTWLKMLVTLTINLVYVIEVGASQPEPKRKAQCTDCGGELQFIGFESTKPQLSNMFDSS